jgi:hypothetical protein
MSDAFGIQEANLGVQEEGFICNQNKTFVLLESAAGLRHSRGPQNLIKPCRGTMSLV